MADEIADLLAAGRDAWPGVELDAARFAAFLGERTSSARKHAAELYLACACAAGDRAALAAFERKYAAVIRGSLARSVEPQSSDDLYQTVLARLLVGEDGGPPRIASYRGESKLSTWLHVVARNVARKQKKVVERPDTEIVHDLADRAAAGDALLAGLKATYQDAFRAAFRTALERLGPRERNLLRYECIEGLEREDIARIYGVSRATVARWRALYRARLHQETCAAFRERVAIGADEVDSVLALIRSQLDITLTPLLDE
jgi:RNA polymerase sigma-70 factor (ECF subfamily)